MMLQLKKKYIQPHATLNNGATNGIQNAFYNVALNTLNHLRCLEIEALLQLKL